MSRLLIAYGSDELRVENIGETEEMVNLTEKKLGEVRKLYKIFETVACEWTNTY